MGTLGAEEVLVIFSAEIFANFALETWDVEIFVLDSQYFTRTFLLATLTHGFTC